MNLVDPTRTGPAIWFQQMAEPRPQRNRIHLDISVPHDVADDRVAAAAEYRAALKLVDERLAAQPHAPLLIRWKALLLAILGEKADAEQFLTLEQQLTGRARTEFDERLRRDHPKAAAFWDSTPPSYRKMRAFWISEAKRPETRERRSGPPLQGRAPGERPAAAALP